jgi:hypothetical protein
VVTRNVQVTLVDGARRIALDVPADVDDLRFAAMRLPTDQNLSDLATAMIPSAKELLIASGEPPDETRIEIIVSAIDAEGFDLHPRVVAEHSELVS